MLKIKYNKDIYYDRVLYYYPTFILLLYSFFFFFFFFNDTATTEIYTLSYTLSLHDALPICHIQKSRMPSSACDRSEEHTSELQSHSEISYAVLCLKQKTQPSQHKHSTLRTSCRHHALRRPER